MDLNIIWFLLIAVLYSGFFLLEGFDFGVGILLPFLGKDDTRRRAIINTIGPFWDGNEVWLLTAGGATFAAFPNWYATLFSGFYLALLLLLLALIVRGVAFEFRSKDKSPRWRRLWDTCIFVGSAVAALLLGVTFANLVHGVPIDQKMQFTGNLFSLLGPYALVGGLASLLCFTLYGAVFISIRTTGGLEQAARQTARQIWPFAVAALILFFVYTVFSTDISARLGGASLIVPIAAVVAVLLSGYFMRRGSMGWSFVSVALTVLLSTATIFLTLFPRVMVSSTNPEFSLTIYNASSSPYTLTVMTIVALIFTPIVLLYQGWTYWIFRKRIEAKPESLHY